uniref:Uncharacterized protein n=1 Tax=Oryzias latipes TaxID=8090 RepID=A0A3P9IET3_ORYLA
FTDHFCFSCSFFERMWVTETRKLPLKAAFAGVQRASLIISRERNSILRERNSILWERNSILWERNSISCERDNNLWEQDINLWEQDIFLYLNVRTRSYGSQPKVNTGAKDPSIEPEPSLKNISTLLYRSKNR